MRGPFVMALLYGAAACSSLDGRALSDAGDDGARGADATDGAAASGGLVATSDRALRRAWAGSVTATSVRFDSAQRVILSAGAANDAERDFALARLTLTGDDARFAGADAMGLSRAPARRGLSRLVSIPRALTVDRQGRIVTVGGGLADNVRDGVVARWLPDGTLDTSFGEGGVVVIFASASSGAGHIVWRAVATEDDGAIVVAGGDAIPYNAATVGVYARITAAGALDPQFGGIHVDARFAGFSALQRDGDGYALAGESVRGGVPSVLYVDATGRRRADAGEDGVVAHTAASAAPMVVRAMLRDGDGGLVVAGGAGPQVWNQTPLRLVRFSAQRHPDTSWGQQGVVRSFTTANWNYELCLSGCLIPWTQGSFLVAGQESFGFRIHRVLRDGSVDAAFAGAGSLGAQPPSFQYLFEMLPDERGGLWVFYRANMERELGALHFSPRPP